MTGPRLDLLDGKLSFYKSFLWHSNKNKLLLYRSAKIKLISNRQPLIVLSPDGLCIMLLLLKIFIPERSSSLSSKRSIMMDGYSTSKYTEDMFVSPPSHCGSNISVSHDPQDYKVRPGCPSSLIPHLSSLISQYLQYLGRSLSTGHESDRGYNSYTTGQSQS